MDSQLGADSHGGVIRRTTRRIARSAWIGPGILCIGMVAITGLQVYRTDRREAPSERRIDQRWHSLPPDLPLTLPLREYWGRTIRSGKDLLVMTLPCGGCGQLESLVEQVCEVVDLIPVIVAREVPQAAASWREKHPKLRFILDATAALVPRKFNDEAPQILVCNTTTGVTSSPHKNETMEEFIRKFRRRG